MHDFTPVEPGVDQCVAVGPSGIECGLPKAHGTHPQITRAPEDETTRRRRAVNDSNTADAAFRAIVKDEDSPMARVFCAIAAAKDRGATDNELYAHPDLTGMPQSTIRPRRVDLETAGLVVRATDATNDNVKRETSPGRYAQVWVLSPVAKVLLQRLDTFRRVA